VPANVRVPTGANSAAFLVKTAQGAATQRAVDITARIGNTPPATARLVVMPSSGGTSQPNVYDLKQNIKK